MTPAVAGTGVAAIAVVAMCLGSVRKVHPTARMGCYVTAAGYGVWLAGGVALTAGMTQGIFWGVIRPMAFVLLVVAGMTGVPQMHRTASEWLDVLLDGTLITAGLFAVVWFVVHAQNVVENRAVLSWQVAWLAFQFILTVPVAGLISRIRPERRVPALCTLGVSVLVLAGDTLALVGGDARLGIPFWVASGVTIGVMLGTGGTLFVDSFADPNRPRQLRWWQLPILPGVLYLADPQQIDAVASALGILIFIVMCVHLMRNTRRNQGLWDSLSTRTRLYEEVLRDSHDAILRIAPSGLIEYANGAVQAVLGTSAERLIGSNLYEWVSHEEFDRARADAADFGVATGGFARLEFSFPGEDGVRRDIEWSMSEQKETSGRAFSGRDVTERNRLQKELVATARIDALTGLQNRFAFLEATDQRMAAAGAAAVLFLDLDGFKQVNDTAGHAMGDAMLVRAGLWLAQSVGDKDLVARLGSDEFAVLAADIDPAAVMALAHSVVAAFTGFDPNPGGRSSVSVSIGVVISRTGRGADLLRDADLAKYRAKQQGGSCVVAFEPWMSEHVLERSRLRSDLESAIHDGGLVVHLQPVVSLPGGSWAGFEALVRWFVGGRMCPPDEFLPLARESGLIVPMDAWVLDEALRQLATIPGSTLGMAVNVSSQWLADPEFGPGVLAALARHSIEPDRLTLEITEQMAVQDLGRTASRLNDLRAEGIQTAIDDFGTGFSSLQYLARLPVDILKIDKKFVSGLGQQGEDDVLVRSMINLASEMGYEVIAEGVETMAQAAQLAEYGCGLAQGYVFSKPRALADLMPELGVPGAAAVLPPRPRSAGSGEDVKESPTTYIWGQAAGR